MRSLSPAIIISLLLFAPSILSAVEPTDWPQWRGPNRDGLVSGDSWPDTLNEKNLKLVWRVENLGSSYSGPIVSADYVFTTETQGDSESAIALDRKTGKQIWKTTWKGSIVVPFFAAKNGSWIRSTPALSEGVLYVAGIRDFLIALDAKTGKEIWKIDFVKEYEQPAPTFGFVCSPLVIDDAIYVQAGGGFAKIEKKTGKVLWRVLKDGGGMDGSAFSSPVRSKIGGQDQLIVQTRTKMAGVELKDGKILWERPIATFRGMNILTPLPFGNDRIFTSTYGGTSQSFQLDQTSQGFTPRDGWSVKYEGYMTTPVVIAGHAYLLGKDKRLVCFDLETGKQAWGTDERFGEYWSLIGNSDKILGLDNRGTLYLLKANPKEYELLDSRKLGTSETWAHLAISGNELFIRDLKGMSVYRWEK